ncbi:MAG: hypothetical protein U0168_20960 [Nannocystaceae bacterium]
MLAAALALWLAPAPVELDWRAPAGCPDREAARASLDRLLAEAGTPEGTPIHATIVVDPQRGGYRAIVQLGEQDDGRTLWSPTCAEVADAALLIVAIAIDPRLGGASSEEPGPGPAVVEPPEPGPSVPEPIAPPQPTSRPQTGPPSSTPPSPEAQPRPLPPVVEPSPPRRRIRPRVPLRALVRASAGLGVGGPGAVTGVVAVGVALASRRVRIELDGDLWTPRRTVVAGDRSVGVRVLGGTAGVRGCGSPLARRLEIPLCAGVRVGALRGEGTGALRSSTQASDWWVSASLGAGLWGWLTPRVALALDLDAMVAFTRPSFTVDPRGTVFSALPGGLRAVFGPVVRLP